VVNFYFSHILNQLGHHYWNGEDEKEKNEMISAKYLSLRNIRDSAACYATKRLLDKKISHRMTLEEFKVITNKSMIFNITLSLTLKKKIFFLANIILLCRTR